MNKNWQIAIAGAIGLGLGLWLYPGRKLEYSNLEEKDCDCGCEGNKDQKINDDLSKPKAGSPLILDAVSRERAVPSSFVEPLKPKRFWKHSGGSAIGRPLDIVQVLDKKFKKAQISVYNPTGQEQEVRLWSDQSESLSPSNPVNLTLPEASDIQKIAWNPANKSLYVLSQLGNKLFVINDEAQLEAEILLPPHSYPGTNSPVDLAIQTDEQSADFGKVYVIGSVANTLSVIDPQHQLLTSFATGTRPISIRFNPDQDTLFILNLVDQNIAVFPIGASVPSLHHPTPLPNPIALEVCPHNGDLYVLNLQSSIVSILSSDGQVLENLDTGLVDPQSVSYNPLTNEMLVVDILGKTARIACSTLQLEVLNSNVRSYHYNEAKQQLYALSQDEKLLQLDLNYNVIESQSTQADRITFNNDGDFIEWVNQEQQLHWSGTQTRSLQFDEDYWERVQDIRYNPIRIRHVRLHLSKDSSVNTLRLIRQTPTGEKESRVLSLSDYRSPQHALNAYDLTGMNGSLIDGRTSWKLSLAPGQRITALIYYQQLQRSRLMPEHSRKSIPIL